MTKQPDWKRMGQAAKERRGALGLLQKDLVAPGLSIDTIRGIEAGRPDGESFRLNTLATMSVALRWPADTLLAIANGSPVPESDVTAEKRLDIVEAEIRAIRQDQAEFRRLLEELVRLGSAGLAAHQDPQP